MMLFKQHWSLRDGCAHGMAQNWKLCTPRFTLGAFSQSAVCNKESVFFFTGSPGVYLHKDSTKHKAEHYMRFVQLVPSLQFFAIKWEARTHRNYRVTVSRQTDQWMQQPSSVSLVALWVCSRHHREMDGGSYLSPAWHPLLEANPFWPQVAVRAA